MGKVYVGVNGKAQQAEKIYVGVNGKAKLVKAAYVGVNGIARKIFPSAPEQKYLYKEGDQCVSVTGGWYHSISDDNFKINHVEMREDAFIRTENKINIYNNYSKVCIDITKPSGIDDYGEYYWAKLIYSDNKVLNEDIRGISGYRIEIAETGRHTYELTLTDQMKEDLNNQYLFVYLDHNIGHTTPPVFWVWNIWLE